MKNTLPITTLIALASVIGLGQAASAQEGSERGNRFNFPLSRYKEEANPLPAHPYQIPAPAPNVHPGTVSHGMSGLDPSFLAPAVAAAPAMRVAPIATKNCTPTVGFTGLVPTNIPKAAAPHLPVANTGQFGAPIVAQSRTCCNASSSCCPGQAGKQAASYCSLTRVPLI